MIHDIISNGMVLDSFLDYIFCYSVLDCLLKVKMYVCHCYADSAVEGIAW